jgi:hypothetical protein
MSETINAIIARLDGKLQKMLVNLAEILTHSPLRVDLNTLLFCYFSQVGMHLGKQNMGPYIDGNCSKHLRMNSFRVGLGTMLLLSKVGPQIKLNGGGRR